MNNESVSGNPGMNRREFCKRAAASGGVVLAAPLLNACARPDADPTAAIVRPRTASQLIATSIPVPTEAPSTATINSQGRDEEVRTQEPVPKDTALPPVDIDSQEKAIIALVKTSNRSFGIQRVMELLKTNPVRAQKVLVKPNFNSADPFPGSTHPDTLRALAVQLFDLGAHSLTVADRSGMGNTHRVMEQLGVFDLSQDLGFDTVVLDEQAEGEWFIQSDSDYHWSAGFPVPKLLLDSECVIQTCNLKTHRYGGHFTMSLKNSVGFVAKNIPSKGHDYMNELHSSRHQRKMIAEINAAYHPSLIVLDGIEAFSSGGPATGHKVQPEVILAGTDPVAIDAVGVAILRLFGTTSQVEHGKVFEQEQIARAAELGLGISEPEQIEIITGDTESETYASLILERLRS